jgi:hypothetical protein
MYSTTAPVAPTTGVAPQAPSVLMPLEEPFLFSACARRQRRAGGFYCAPLFMGFLLEPIC